MRSSVPSGIYHGWRVVAAAFVVALFGWGVGFYGPGIYLVALRDGHGWSSVQLSSAITLYYLLGAGLIVFAGRTFERFGARTVVTSGTCAMAAALVLLTLVEHSWQVYPAFAVMSLGWAAMSGAAVNIIVAPWFERRRGLALSLALNGASAGGVVVAPLVIMLIGAIGFGAALRLVAALMLALVLPPVWCLLRSRRSDERDRVDDAVARPVDTVAARPPRPSRGRYRLATIAIPFALGLAAQVGFLTHQVAFLAPMVGTEAAGWAVSLTTVAAIVGRLVTGLFIDRADRRVAACGNFLLQVVALAILAGAADEWLLLLGCFLFGLGVGNMISLPALIVQAEFEARDFARIVSLVTAINQVTFAFGPAMLGLLEQVGGSYTAPLLVCLAIQTLAATIVIAPALRMRRHA
ncbi:MAG: MFS transporter [Pseudomonadota bacterium]